MEAVVQEVYEIYANLVCCKHCCLIGASQQRGLNQSEADVLKRHLREEIRRYAEQCRSFKERKLYLM